LLLYKGKSAKSLFDNRKKLFQQISFGQFTFFLHIAYNICKSQDYPKKIVAYNLNLYPGIPQ